MPGKRINMAASLKAQGPRKATRTDIDNGGAVVVCARPWGSALPAFAGPDGSVAI